MTITTKINAARAFGSIAFAKGAPAIPAADSNLFGLLEGMAVGSGGVQVMKAWLQGWTQANLAA